jgi:hypothetical protein
MKRLIGTVCVLAVAVGAASAAGPPDLLKSKTRFPALRPGVTYQASLFAPAIRVTAPDANWGGGQFVSQGYDWVVLAQRPPRRGGVVLVSAPQSTQSAATTLHRLETERADIPAVGISVEPAVPVTIDGFRGKQFDGTVTGQYGHTFVPFSGKSSGASSSAGDHIRLPKGTAFRIIVLDVRGKVVVFEIDSDTGLDDAFVARVTKVLALLRFPKT